MNFYSNPLSFQFIYKALLFLDYNLSSSLNAPLFNRLYLIAFRAIIG